MAARLEDLALDLEGLQDVLCGLARLLAGHDGTDGARSQIEWSASHLLMAIRELRGEAASEDPGRKLPQEPGAAGGLIEGLRGHTRAITIPEVLGFVASLRKSGLLRVNSPEEAFLIQLDAGQVVYALGDNAPPGARLGEILVSQGALAPEDLARFLAGREGELQRLGQELLDRGLVTREALRIALAFQVQLAFHRLFRACDAVYQFDEGRALPDSGDIRLDVTSLLLESARSTDEGERDGQAATPAAS